MTVLNAFTPGKSLPQQERIEQASTPSRAESAALVRAGSESLLLPRIPGGRGTVRDPFGRRLMKHWSTGLAKNQPDILLL